MKKITLFLFALFSCWQISAQVGILQSFPTTTAPTAWTLGGGSLSTDQSCATASWRKNVYSSTTGGILTSESQISNGSDLTISFDYKIVNWSAATVATNPFNGTITTEVSIDGGTTWTVQAGVINSTNHVASNTCTTKTYVVPGASVPNASSVKVRWNCVWGTSGDYYVYIDNISATQPTTTPPLCTTLSTPANNASNVTNSIISWAPASGIPTGYKLRVGSTSGGTDVLNNADVGNVLTYTLPQLDSGTTYFVTVTPYNANGDATGCAETSFTTCDEIGDFSENFDSLTATGQIPSCWNRVLTNISGATIGTSTTTPSSAPYSIALANSSSTAAANIMLVTPALNNLSAGTNRLRFSARNTTETQDIEVGTLTNPSDPSTFSLIQSIDLGTTFQDYSVSFASYTGTNKYIAIRRLSTSTFTTVYIDNVAWEPIPAVVPTCVAITSPTDQAINVTNSRVTWSNSLEATGYKISVGYQSGATDVLNMFDVGNVTSYVVPTDPGTTYFVTVYPYNSFGTATGCSEISFTTCDALFPDVTETFATFLPSCWLNMTGGDLVTGPTSTTGSGWVADGFANNGTTGAVRNEIWTTGANDWLISPFVTIPASGYELRFDAAATQYATSNAPTTAWEADDFIQVLVSTGFSNWTVLYTYDNTNQPGITATSNIINLDAYAGMDVRFAFRAVEGTANGNADIDFFIDNFKVRLTPDSAPSCATNIVATPNATCGNFATVITWDAAVSADGYNIAIGTTPGTGNVVNLGNVLTYSFIGNIGTTYYYTIVPYNAFGSATGCTEQSFTTNANGCYCSSAPTSVDGDGITNILLGSVNFPNTVSTSPVYNDHTATVVDMSRGVNNNVQISFDTDYGYDYNIVIWIDANDDFNLDASEIVYTGLAPDTPIVTHNASFVMPGTMPLGQHRMRIVATDVLQTPANPCYSGTYGETVDFIINVVAAPSCLPPTNLSVGNITATSANLIWTESGTATSWDIEWGTLGFTPTGTPTISGATNPQSISGLSSNTTYSFYVRSNCGAGGFSTWSGPFSFTTACVAENVPYSMDFETAIVPNLPNCTSQQNIGSGNLWTVQSNPGYGFTTKALRYSWNSSNAANVWFYTNGINLTAGTTYRISYSYGGTALYPEKLKVAYGTSPLATAMTTVLADYSNVVNDTPNNVFVDFTPTASGVYYFGFNAYSIANQFYLFVDNIVVDVALSNTDFDNSNFIAYPNPVKDVLNVSYSTEISSIRVINMIGQEVISRNVNASSTQVDMSELSAGTYIVNVTLGDAVKTLKVVKQ